MNSDEIERLASIFVRSGVTKIRLTGGEPTIRPDFLDIVARLDRLRANGLQKIGVTTNGIILHRSLDALKEAGLDQINVSLDTLDPHKFVLMTRRKGLERVLKSVHGAVDAGFETKLNVVVIRKVNDMEICDFVDMTRELPLTVRFIEYMPFDGNRWNMDKFVPYSDMLDTIKLKYTALGGGNGVEKVDDDANDTTKAYKISGFKGKFGFITSMSDHFCGTCNRLRLLADGNLKVCLFGNKEVNLLEVLRRIESSSSKSNHDCNYTVEEELELLIDAAVKRKKKQHAGMKELSQMPNRPMILIGG